jgi:hypothetical protein
MTTYAKLAITAMLVVLAASAMAENPFAGTWKFDASKSKITGQTVTFAAKPAGMVEITAGGQSYSFKPDGTATKDPFGEMAAWTKIDDGTWKVVYTKDSTVLDTDIWKLSADGKSIQVSSSGTRPDGSSFSETETYVRLTPGTGFLAKWKNTKASSNSPDTRVIQANGDDGIIWNIPEIKASLALKFDGKDVAPTGPTVPAGLALAATRIGARKFEIVEKMNGKLIFKATNEVSGDGKTMTSIGSAAGVSEPTTYVYDKQ